MAFRSIAAQGLISLCLENNIFFVLNLLLLLLLLLLLFCFFNIKKYIYYKRIFRDPLLGYDKDLKIMWIGLSIEHL